MKYRIQYGLTLTALSCVFFSSQTAHAQGIDLSAAFKPALEAMAKQMADAMHRRLVMDPADLTLPAVDSMVTITVTNNYKDSARALIKIHASPPPKLIAVDTTGVAQVKKPKRSLVADDTLVNSGTAYKNLTPWITPTTTEIQLAPGETKTFTVGLRIPTDAPTGEYAAWIATHVVVPPTKGKAASDTVESSVQSPTGKTTKVQVMGISATIPPGTQIVAATKVVVTK